MRTNLKGLATMQTQTQLERDRLVEKVQKVRELYADAPENGPSGSSASERRSMNSSTTSTS